jgi:hypothetical protein
MRHSRTHTLLATLISAAINFTAIVLVAPQAHAATLYDQLSAYIPAQTLSPYASILGPTGNPLPLPASPAQALIVETTALSAAAGLPHDPTAAVIAATLPADLSGRLANVELAQLKCILITQQALNGITPSQLEQASAEDGSGSPLDASRFAAIPGCATALWQASNDLTSLLQSNYATPAYRARLNLDIWPVIKVTDAPGTTFLNDYMLSVAVGGHDTYINNMGSNMIDINYSPPGSAVKGLRGIGPAKGCQRAIPGLTAGDCIPLAAVLIDTGAYNTYGVKQAPDIDATCTQDPVIRRMVVGGVGFAGAGTLIDTGGHAKFTGKTGSLGAGHIFGVGILDARGGYNSYSAIRNSEGFALVGGFGLLRDRTGNATFDYHMPSPSVINPVNEAPGSGGVISDRDVCDHLPRFIQGAGNVSGGLGVLAVDGGSNQYHGAYIDTFTAPAPQVTTGRAGSQGFGNNQAFGALVDVGNGSDTYVIDGNQGMPVRGDNTIIPPDPNCKNSTCSGVFIAHAGHP